MGLFFFCCRYDHCFDSFDPASPTFVSQRAVFEAVGLDILAKAWSGYHACLFAYGQTGSGKTHSIMGYDRDQGVIPRVCEALFWFIGHHGADLFKVDACYLEVYNEAISDLLSPPPVEEDYVPLKPKVCKGSDATPHLLIFLTQQLLVSSVLFLGDTAAG